MLSPLTKILKKDVYGSITCIYEVESGEIDILSEYFEKPFDIFFRNYFFQIIN